jgi:hypothetical protein
MQENADRARRREGACQTLHHFLTLHRRWNQGELTPFRV